jgi:ABC-type polysaccharide/polyol phosphate export permease
MDKIGSAMRAFFLFIGLLMWSGIWLTGFDVVHWLLYLPATFFMIAAVTGICPGMIFFQEVFREPEVKKSEENL